MQVIKINKTIDKWQFHELPVLITDAIREIWSVKICKGIGSLRYVIVVCQANRKCIYYPLERIRYNFTNLHFTEALYKFTEFAPNYMI